MIVQAIIMEFEMYKLRDMIMVS